MKIWNDIFVTWQQFNPFLHRSLLNKKDLVDWADKLKLFRLVHQDKDYFLVFIDYLEENGLFSPLIVTKKGSEFGQQCRMEKGRYLKNAIVNGDDTTFKEDRPIWNEVVSYYHPFQFFQLLTYYRYFNRFLLQIIIQTNCTDLEKNHRTIGF